MPKLGIPGLFGTGPSAGLLGFTGPGLGLGGNVGLPKLPGLGLPDPKAGLAGMSKMSFPPANGLPGMPKIAGLGLPGALGAGLPKLGMLDGKIPGLLDLANLGKAGNGLLQADMPSMTPSLDGMSPPSMGGSTAKGGAVPPAMEGATAKGGLPGASPVGATAKAGGPP